MIWFSGASLTSVDKNGNQPIHLAAARNHRAIIEFFHEIELDMNVSDQSGRSPVHLAARNGGTRIQ